MDKPPANRCGYTWPEDHEVGDDPEHQSCCYRETVSANVDRCIWHVDADKVDKKTIEALREVSAPSKACKQNAPFAELLDGAKLSEVNLGDALSFELTALRDVDLSNANLRGADFSGADLQGTDLSNANLQDTQFIGTDLPNADLTDANLPNTTFSEANLANTDLTDANLQGADFTDAYLPNSTFINAHLLGTDFIDANLWGVDFTDADLEGSDLTGATLQDGTLDDADFQHTTLTDANLRSATLTDVDLRETTIEDITVNGATEVTQFYEDIEFDPEDWDATARAHHDLKTVFSDHGLIGKARNQHVRERRARASEAKATTGHLNGWGNPIYFWSWVSRLITGYGVRVWNPLVWMGLLFLVSTAVYVYTGVEDTLVNNVTYSVITFTSAPPAVPKGFWIQLMVMIETFCGTLLLVLLGYILGNREQL